MGMFHLDGLEPRRLFSVPSGFSETRIGPTIARTTSMTLAPDGRIFVSEQDGDLRVIKNGTLLSTPFVTVNASNAGERGLIGTVFDPDHATNRFIYAFYTHDNAGTIRNRVSRFTAAAANPDRAEAGSETVIFETDALGSSEWHNGGSLHFGPDGKLYISVGENNVSSNAQTLTKVLGKMLRINKDGTIPTDNPFYNQTTGRNRAIWAMGLRNPFTFAFQPGTGRMFINDVGGTKFEEINDGVAGANYGWPATEGSTTNSAYKSPFYAYAHGASGEDDAIAGGAFYNPKNRTFPSEYLGDYFFGEYGKGWVKRIDTTTKAVNTLVSNATDIVDVDVHDDGSLYYLSRHGGVFRVARTGSSAPVITTHPDSKTVAKGQDVSFTVTASGQNLAYQWQRDGVDIAGATSATFSLSPAQLTDDGDAFRVRVSNSAGSVTSNAATLTVLDDDAPTAEILTPVVGSTYAGGTTISFSGAAADPEDGDLPASAFTWEVLFHHDTHNHPGAGPFTGITSGSFNIPDLGETSDNVWYRIHLTVTDSVGLTHSVFRDVLPQKATIGLETNVPGLTLTLDGAPVTAPSSFVGVVGIKRNLGAPATQSLNGKLYEFTGWSDGGERVHDIATPDVDTIYTATYEETDGVLATIRAAADSYVRNGTFAGQNFGNASEIPVKQSRTTGNTREGYIRFVLGQLGEVAEAKLRLFGKLSVDMPGGMVARLVAVSNTTWSESGLTWNNKPAQGVTLGEVTVTDTAGQWYEVDVTDYLRQQKLAGATAVSFAMKGPSITDPWIIFASDEAAANQPELAVLHDGQIPVPPPTTTLPAAADGYVRNGTHASTNFGNDGEFLVKRSGTTGNTREAYLRFDVSTLAPVATAKLRLFGRLSAAMASGLGLQLYAVSNTTWSETGLTWNNKPATGSALGGVKTIATTTGQWYEWDVTSYLQQQRLAGATGVSFALKAPNTSDPWAIFNSGENALNAPQLVVDHGA